MKLIPTTFDYVIRTLVKDRSVPRSIHSWNHAPFPPPSFCFDARTLIGGRYRYEPNKLFRVSLTRIGPVDTNRKVAGEWREKFDSLVIRCQAEPTSMTKNGQCFSMVFFKSCFNETIVKRIWRKWRINKEGGEKSVFNLAESRVIDFRKVIFLFIHFGPIINRLCV